MAARLVEQQFRAMGTACAVAAVTRTTADHASALRALAAARAEVDACERVLTRFDERSDLCRLNRGSGSWVEVDARLVAALRAAVLARRLSAGRFDPTVLPALVAAGYDRTFDELEGRPARQPTGWRAGAAISLDEDGSRARVAPGAAVDLGGIGKGFGAVRALDAMRAAWRDLPGGLVDLGGDLAFFGVPPGGGRWRIAVADPRSPGATLATLGVGPAGVATSGRDRRRFGPGRALHHLIDPATGAPAAQGPLAVTVVARDATEAEWHATALSISTLAEARDHVRRFPPLAALVVPAEGAPVVLGDLPLVPNVRIPAAA
jgi:FAD:protein FMN transferase